MRQGPQDIKDKENIMTSKVQQLLLTSTAILGMAVGSATSIFASADDTTDTTTQKPTLTQVEDKGVRPDIQNEQGYSILMAEGKVLRTEKQEHSNEIDGTTDPEIIQSKELHGEEKLNPTGLIVNQAVTAGETITVTNQAGEQVATFTVDYDNANGVQLMYPELTEGENYDVSINGNNQEVTAETVTMPARPEGEVRTKEEHDLNKQSQNTNNSNSNSELTEEN